MPCQFSFSCGSSPLARGLLQVRVPSGAGAGIIPARAGFTSRHRARWPGCSDHPRSRGVYSGGVLAESGPDGSSPLARGLPPGLASGRLSVGIIPARAGFTCRRRHACRPPPDHPRSRGVYINPGTWTGDMYGSSPLARGLRRCGAGQVPGPRIIPARAGFTPSPSPAPAARRDHPRSRGVYSLIGFPNMTGDGSSPLARGLRDLTLLHRLPEGIIPARAGFTSDEVTATRMAADHPRSRGVYAEELRARAGDGGSSPLARGLPGGPGPEDPLRRIIPARAGFTPRCRPWRRRRTDHPRSRGVYQAIDASDATNKGSSPLARGLLT